MHVLPAEKTRTVVYPHARKVLMARDLFVEARASAFLLVVVQAFGLPGLGGLKPTPRHWSRMPSPETPSLARLTSRLPPTLALCTHECPLCYPVCASPVAFYSRSCRGGWVGARGAFAGAESGWGAVCHVSSGEGDVRDGRGGASLYAVWPGADCRRSSSS